MRFFKPGEVLVREGDRDLRLYIVVTGSVIIYKNYQKVGETRLEELVVGEFFGEQSLFLGIGQPATAVAAQETLAYSLTRAEIFDFFRDEPDAAFALCADICQRLKAMSRPEFETVSEPETTPAPAPAPAPEPEPDPEREAGFSAFFPPGHGHYRLPEPEEAPPPDIIFKAKEKCPVCGMIFEASGVRESKLIRRRTDADLREHFKGVEPIHYDVITCPQCWYSALRDNFDAAEPADPQRLLAELTALHRDLDFNFDNRRDAAEVFTGYYLALRSAPLCFRQAEAQTARLWLKLSRLYEDCGDGAMAEYANRQALAAYEEVYQRANLNARAMQRLQFIMGDLHFKLGAFREARDLLFKAKTARGGTEQIRLCADNRLDLMREAEKQPKT
jgi:uncharacterized protein (DUF2225 family)